MKVKVAVLGCTGFVGRKYCELLQDHPYFSLEYVAASEKSVGNASTESGLTIQDVESVPEDIPLIFSALPSSCADVESRYATHGKYVVSSSSAFRKDPRVPVVIPEVNGHHLDILGQNGGIVCKPNCTVQGVAIPLFPLLSFAPVSGVVVTMQAISGGGKSAKNLFDNIIPYIPHEEEKLSYESKKLLGACDGDTISQYPIALSTQCARVPVLHGHVAQMHITFTEKITSLDCTTAWNSFQGLDLPSAPKSPLIYMDDPYHPQPLLDRDVAGGMAVCIGRLKEVDSHTIKMTTLSHNILRGAAGGGVLIGELLYSKGIVSYETKSTSSETQQKLPVR